MCNLCDFAWPGTAKAHDKAANSQRRNFLRAGAVAAAAPWSLGSALAAPAAGDAAPNAIPPAEALKRLMDGNARYAANKPTENDFSAGRAARTKVQYPIAAILSCADSRLAPEFAFDQGPGDLFVVRTAGNYAAPALLSSLEYAVAVLNVPLIVVLGHSNCGAVSAAVKSIESRNMLPGTMQDIISAIQPAVVRAQGGPADKLLDRAIFENVKMQEQALEVRPSLVAKMFREKKIDIVGGVYDLATGKVTLV
jgi:carbonic anhydrase